MTAHRGLCQVAAVIRCPSCRTNRVTRAASIPSKKDRASVNVAKFGGTERLALWSYTLTRQDLPRMNYASLLERIRRQVDEEAYQTPTSHLPEHSRKAMAEIAEALRDAASSPTEVRALVHRLAKEGRIDRVLKLSALHVIAASPRVRDWAEAARLAGEQEFAALEEGGPHLEARLASVDRHRGVLAFLRGHYETALDYFTRALEREHTAENLGNILCTLCRMGQVDSAIDLLQTMRKQLPEAVLEDLDQMIHSDPDLAVLRSPGAPS